MGRQRRETQDELTSVPIAFILFPPPPTPFYIAGFPAQIHFPVLISQTSLQEQWQNE
jgi:hypothetical protein